MIECPYCKAANDKGTTRCAKCGAWFSGSEPAAGEAGAVPEPGSDTADERILNLLRANKKIDAIKIYREKYHVGLKEAKDAVEAIAKNHGIPQTSGCGAAAFLVAATLVAGVASLLLAIGG